MPAPRSGQIDSTASKIGAGLQQHSFSAAERPVIHGLMPVLRPVPQIVHANLDQTGFARPLNHTVIERPAEKLREDRQDVE